MSKIGNPFRTFGNFFASQNIYLKYLKKGYPNFTYSSFKESNKARKQTATQAKTKQNGIIP